MLLFGHLAGIGTYLLCSIKPRDEKDMSLLPSQAPNPSCSGRCPGYPSRPGFAPDRLQAQRRLRWRSLRPRAEFSASGDAAPDDHRAEWERPDHEREAERLFRSAQLQERQRIGAEYGEVCALPHHVAPFPCTGLEVLFRLAYVECLSQFRAAGRTVDALALVDTCGRSLVTVTGKFPVNSLCQG